MKKTTKKEDVPTNAETEQVAAAPQEQVPEVVAEVPKVEGKKEEVKAEAPKQELVEAGK